jgi:hypothetical protein
MSVGPTTNAERFSALRDKITAYAQVIAAEMSRRSDDAPRGVGIVQCHEAVNADLRELEAIVRSADDVLQATTANTKHAARNELYARLRKWRRWPEPEQVT